MSFLCVPSTSSNRHVIFGLQAYLLDTINNKHITIFIKHTHITCLHPAIFCECLRVGFWVTQVSFHNVWPFDPELTIDKLGRHIRKQFSDRPPLHNVNWCNTDYACRLCHTVAASNGNLCAFLDQVNEITT